MIINTNIIVPDSNKCGECGYVATDGDGYRCPIFRTALQTVGKDTIYESRKVMKCVQCRESEQVPAYRPFNRRKFFITLAMIIVLIVAVTIMFALDPSLL